jgi:hypothetical protein
VRDRGALTSAQLVRSSQPYDFERTVPRREHDGREEEDEEVRREEEDDEEGWQEAVGLGFSLSLSAAAASGRPLPFPAPCR